jgi:hypothetical protein
MDSVFQFIRNRAEYTTRNGNVEDNGVGFADRLEDSYRESL